MAHCHKRMGDAYFRTPRTTITAFIGLLAVLEQNPHTQWSDHIAKLDVQTDTDPHTLNPTADTPATTTPAARNAPASGPSTSRPATGDADDDLATFRL